jgi:hypothetical protein
VKHPNWPDTSVSVRFYFSDADPCAECECGWRTQGDAAVDAFSSWWKHLRDNSQGSAP